MFAQLRYHFKGVDPDTLPDHKIYELFAQLEWVRIEEAKAKSKK